MPKANLNKIRCIKPSSHTVFVRLQGSECWTVTKLIIRMEAAEMGFLRPVAGYRVRDDNNNENNKEFEITNTLINTAL